MRSNFVVGTIARRRVSSVTVTPSPFDNGTLRLTRTSTFAPHRFTRSAMFRGGRSPRCLSEGVREQQDCNYGDDDGCQDCGHSGIDGPPPRRVSPHDASMLEKGNRNKNRTNDIGIQAFDTILQLGVGYWLIA